MVDGHFAAGTTNSPNYTKEVSRPFVLYVRSVVANPFPSLRTLLVLSGAVLVRGPEGLPSLPGYCRSGGPFSARRAELHGEPSYTESRATGPNILILPPSHTFGYERAGKSVISGDRMSQTCLPHGSGEPDDEARQSSNQVGRFAPHGKDAARLPSFALS